MLTSHWSEALACVRRNALTETHKTIPRPARAARRPRTVLASLATQSSRAVAMRSWLPIDRLIQTIGSQEPSQPTAYRYASDECGWRR